MNVRDVVKASKIVNPNLPCFRLTDEDGRVEVVCMGLVFKLTGEFAPLNASLIKPASASESEL